MLRALISACGRTILFCLALSCAGTAFAGNDAFRWDPKVVRGELANGLSYYLVPLPDGAPHLTLQLLVRVGSLDERDDQSGVAHMVEHMVFHASRAHPEGLNTFMAAQGWSVGMHYNAQTNFERTLYTLQPERQAQKIEAALEVLAEIAGAAQMPDEAWARERPIILEEWRTKLGLTERMERQRRALLRAGSLYPQRPPIGSEASIRSQPASALRSFYADWYRPGNMALLIAGDFDPVALQARIEAHFGGLQAAALPARNPRNPELGSSLRIGRIQDAESGSSQVNWVYRFETDQRQNREGFRNRLIDRLAERAVRQAARQAAGALPAEVETLVSSRGELGGQVASLGFSSRVGLAAHGEGLRQILLLQERLRREGVDRKALEAEIAEIHRINERALEVHAKRDAAGWLQQLHDAVLDGRVLQDPQQKQADVRAIMAGLGAAEVEARVRQWLASPDRLLFMLAPGLSPLRLPEAAEVEALQKRLASEALPPPAAPLAPAQAAVSSVPEPASAGEIVAETRDEENAVVRWRLANGDEFVWLRQPGARLQFAASSGAGYRQAGAPAWQWQLAAQLATQADLPGQPAGSLNAWASAQKLTLNQSQSDARQSWNAAVPAERLDDLFRLFAARQQAHALDPQQLAASQRQLARQIARQPSSVSSRAARTLAELRFESEAGDATPGPEEIEALAGEPGQARIEALIRRLAVAPTRYFLAGEIAPETLRAAIERHLAGLPREAAAVPAKPLLQRSGEHARRLAIGIEPQGSVRAHGSQRMSWSPERAIGVGVLSRVVYRTLRSELREARSGIYRLNFSMTLDPASNRLNSELHFTADPARIDALWAHARRVLAGIGKGLDPRVLESEIQRMQAAEALRREDAAIRFNRLQLSFERWGDARYLASSRSLSEALEPARLQALAAELALTRDMASLILLPDAARGEGGQ